MNVLNKIIIAFFGLLSLAMLTGALGTGAVFYLDWKAGNLINGHGSQAANASKAAFLVRAAVELEAEIAANPLLLQQKPMRDRWAQALSDLEAALEQVEKRGSERDKDVVESKRLLASYRSAAKSLSDLADSGFLRLPVQSTAIMGPHAGSLAFIGRTTEARARSAFADIQAAPAVFSETAHMIALISGAIVGTGTILVVIMSISIFRTLREPLRITLDRATKMSSGDLTVEFDSGRKDEFGRIWGAFSSIVHRLREVLGQVGSVSRQVASVSQHVSEATSGFSSNAQTQAASSEEISAAVEELIASIQTVANDAREQVRLVADLSAGLTELSGRITETDSRFRQGRTVAATLLEEANLAQAAMGTLRASMDGISENSERVSDIVEIISDISERINLLSLNASIEAARAGDAGRGFAVVATEISRLADQTAASIKNISQLTLENEQEVRGGADSTAATASGLEKIQEGMQSLSSVIEDLSTAMAAQVAANATVSRSLGILQVSADGIRQASAEQSRSTDEIARSIQDITSMSQSTAARAEELAKTAADLRRMSVVVSDRLGFFKIETADEDHP